MCGIAGIIDLWAPGGGKRPIPSLDLLEKMAASLAHRGPDAFGMYRDQRASLVHARLSIIDLAGGGQPLSNERGTIWIVFNGEIFNYIELRQELQSLGHLFRTSSDTEVIVHAYEQWGEECFPRFNGQWAVALWDSASGRLTLSRDRVGVRPLYVKLEGGRLWFASEVKALFVDPAMRRALDVRGLDQTFTYWAPLPPTTLFEGIEELPAGSYRIYDSEGLRSERYYWRPSYPLVTEESRKAPSAPTLAEATEELRAKLARATALRMLRADVPVGSYLSGGLDSSVIARLGHDAKQEGEFKTFSVRFEESPYDETAYQRAMASTLRSSHEEVMVGKRDIARVFPEVVRHAEKPLLRTAAAPLFILSGLVASAGIKAVLTGEGADEMLGGYDLFREAKIREFWSRAPGSQARPMLFDRLYPYLQRAPQHARGMALQFWAQGLDRAGEPGFTHEPRWRTTSMLKKFYAPDVRRSLAGNPAPDVLETLPPEFTRWDTLAQAQYLETVTLLGGYLLSSQGDRMLMAHSVEGRFPFLDSDVMDFCNSLPALFKLPGLNEKMILKRMARGLVPDIILQRPKQPYRAPDASSFFSVDGKPAEYVDQAFSETALAGAGLFDVQTVRRFFLKCCSAAARGASDNLSNVDNMTFVGILSAQILSQQFVQSRLSSNDRPVHFSTVIDSIMEITYGA